MELRKVLKKIEANKEALDKGTTIYPEPLWPNEEILPILGLLQHYKRPTRLLDWTQDKNTAVYFAAKSYLKQIKKGSNPEGFIVWALNIRNLSLINHQPIEIIHPPSASNPNLMAQKGVFTLYRPEKELNRPCNDTKRFFDKKRMLLPPSIDDRPLDEIIKEKEVGYTHALQTQTAPVIVKITFINANKEKAQKLLELLWNEGMNAATIFPGYRGVAKAIDEMPDKNHDKPIEKEIEETDIIILLRKGNEYKKDGKLLEAKPYFYKAHKIEPDNIDVLFELGKFHAHMSEPEKSEDWYFRCIYKCRELEENSNPNNEVRKIYNLSLAYKVIASLRRVEMNDKETAREYCRVAIYWFDEIIKVCNDSDFLENIKWHKSHCLKALEKDIWGYPLDKVSTILNSQ